MNTAEQSIDRAEQHCKTHGVRLTSKRKQVLQSLIEAEKALSAYELIDIFKEKFGSSMPPMSMYRILDFLQEENLVHKLYLTNRYVACSKLPCDHSHSVPQFLICSKCQKVEEISISEETITSLQTNAKDAGFYLLSPQLEMNCICDKCKSKIA